jgi:hypothetical protein
LVDNIGHPLFLHELLAVFTVLSGSYHIKLCVQEVFKEVVFVTHFQVLVQTALVIVGSAVKLRQVRVADRTVPILNVLLALVLANQI